MVVLRRRAREEGFTLIEGSAAWAEPGGLLQRRAYEELRDEILGQLRAALPVDAVVLGLHGAMVAQGYDDCEGDLLSRVRAIVGPGVADRRRTRSAQPSDEAAGSTAPTFSPPSSNFRTPISSSAANMSSISRCARCAARSSP